MKITKEQIQEWKKKYGDIYCIGFDDGKETYIKKPNRKTVSLAMTKMQTNPLAYAEVILNQCFIGGDESFRTNDAYFFGASAQLEQIMEVKSAEIKKL